MKKLPQKIPFDFVLEKLADRNPIVRPMFGCHAVYLGEKIVMVLRKKADPISDNGVWVATSREHHESLRKEFPSLRSIGVFGTGESAWQNLPEDAPDFEEGVFLLCEKIIRNDERIGRIPVKKNSGARKKGR